MSRWQSVELSVRVLNERLFEMKNKATAFVCNASQKSYNKHHKNEKLLRRRNEKENCHFSSNALEVKVMSVSQGIKSLLDSPSSNSPSFHTKGQKTK